MPIRKYDDLIPVDVQMEGAHGVSKKVPIGAQEGWDGYTLRTFTLEPGGHTPKHTHDWEHVNYVIKGKGRLLVDGEVQDIKEKDFAFVPPNTEHQFTNPHEEAFEFICIVPNRGEF